MISLFIRESPWVVRSHIFQSSKIPSRNNVWEFFLDRYGMKKLLYLAVILCGLMFSCQPYKDAVQNQAILVNLIFQDTITQHQLYSILTFDNLPVITTWSAMSLQDPDTETKYTHFLYLDTINGTSYTVKYLRESQKYILLKRRVLIVPSDSIR